MKNVVPVMKSLLIEPGQHPTTQRVTAVFVSESKGMPVTLNAEMLLSDSASLPISDIRRLLLEAICDAAQDRDLPGPIPLLPPR